ncbi:MAG TPA: hypothetical protein VM223_15755 [Planctomycetota bacterium]|nr:hypothetical protein [Planctomycetota bacterium]
MAKPKITLGFRVLNALAYAGLNPRSVDTLARELGTNHRTVLGHLRQLEWAGFARETPAGQWEIGPVIYRAVRKLEEDRRNG